MPRSYRNFTTPSSPQLWRIFLSVTTRLHLSRPVSISFRARHDDSTLLEWLPLKRFLEITSAKCCLKITSAKASCVTVTSPSISSCDLGRMAKRFVDPTQIASIGQPSEGSLSGCLHLSCSSIGTGFNGTETNCRITHNLGIWGEGCPSNSNWTMLVK